MKKLLFVFIFLFSSVVNAGVTLPTRCLPAAAAPVTCSADTQGRCYTSTGDTLLYYCDGTTWQAIENQAAIALSLGTCTNQFVRAVNGGAGPTCASVSMTADITGTLAQNHGGTDVAAASDDQMLISNGSAWQVKTLPDCTDSTGNHLNYTAAANGWSCGSSITTSLANSWSNTNTFTSTVVQNASVQGNFATKALTSAGAAVAFVTVTTVSGSAGNVFVQYSNEVANSTDFQSFGGTIDFDYVNKAGTITCSTGVPSTATEPALAVSTASTLTHTFSCADGGSNVLQLKVTDTSNLASITSNLIRYTVRVLAPTTLTVTAQ